MSISSFLPGEAPPHYPKSWFRAELERNGGVATVFITLGSLAAATLISLILSSWGTWAYVEGEKQKTLQALVNQRYEATELKEILGRLHPRSGYTQRYEAYMRASYLRWTKDDLKAEKLTPPNLSAGKRNGNLWASDDLDE